MSKDRREDEGQYYPGGSVVPRGPVTPGGGGGTPADYSTVRTNAAAGAAHAAKRGSGSVTDANPHGMKPSDLKMETGQPLDSAVRDANDRASSAIEEISYHRDRTDNPHATTAEQVGAYTKTEVDEKISQNAAHYLTAKVGGAFVQFATHAALAAAKAAHTEENPQFWYGDDPHTPDKNDYLTILDDETHGHATTRYMFVGEWPDGLFRYQYTVNPTALTQAQWDALNSGATKEKIDEIDRKLDRTDVINPATATTEGKAAEAVAVKMALAKKCDVARVNSKYTPIRYNGEELDYVIRYSGEFEVLTSDLADLIAACDRHGVIKNLIPGLTFGGYELEVGDTLLDISAFTSDIADATKLTPVYGDDWVAPSPFKMVGQPELVFMDDGVYGLAWYDIDGNRYETYGEHDWNTRTSWDFRLAGGSGDVAFTATRSIVGYKLGTATAETDPTLNGMSADDITTLAEAAVENKVTATNPDFVAAVEACFENGDEIEFGGAE